MPIGLSHCTMRMEWVFNSKNPSPGRTTSKLAADCQKWEARRDDTGHKTNQSPAFNNHRIIKGKTTAERKKHWKCKPRCVAVKSSGWALCWVHGGIQWPWGSLTCWMSQEYALPGIRQCRVIWLQSSKHKGSTVQRTALWISQLLKSQTDFFKIQFQCRNKI